MRFKGSTIFVTGGGGFIGSAVVRHLLSDTHARVVNIDKLTYAANLDSLPGATENLNYTFEKQCICEGSGLRRLFEKYQPDAVMNLAARACRPLDRRPGEFIRPTCRHLHAVAKRCAIGALSSAVPLLHISTNEGVRLARQEGFRESTARAQLALFGEQGVVRPGAPARTYELPTLVTSCSNSAGLSLGKADPA